MHKSLILVAGGLLMSVISGGLVLAQSRSGSCDRACLEGFVERYLGAEISIEIGNEHEKHIFGRSDPRHHPGIMYMRVDSSYGKPISAVSPLRAAAKKPRTRSFSMGWPSK
jgi:hypothetical protein